MELETYENIKNYLIYQEVPKKVSGQQLRKWRNYSKRFYFKEEILYRKGKNLTRVLKLGETEPILYLYHANPLSGHLGF